MDVLGQAWGNDMSYAKTVTGPKPLKASTSELE